MDAPLSTVTSPMSVAVGAMKASSATRGLRPSNENRGMPGQYRPTLRTLLDVRRGRLGSALVLACLAACAPRASTGRSGGPTASAPTPTDAPPIQTGQGGATATTTGGQRGTPTTAGAQRGTATTTGGQGGGATGSGSTGAATPAEPYAGAKGGVGAFARTLLRPQPATRLVIEVFTQQGATPASNTLNHAASVLGGASHKPVSVPAAIAVGGGAQDWTVAQLTELADRQGKAQQGG